jgi:hypothetical protein
MVHKQRNSCLWPVETLCSRWTNFDAAYQQELSMNDYGRVMLKAEYSLQAIALTRTDSKSRDNRSSG